MNVGERSVDVDFLRPIEDRLKKLSVRLQKTAAIKSVGVSDVIQHISCKH
jgi:hypothetical protein